MLDRTPFNTMIYHDNYVYMYAREVHFYYLLLQLKIQFQFKLSSLKLISPLIDYFLILSFKNI